jgi:hypothetical protein
MPHLPPEVGGTLTEIIRRPETLEQVVSLTCVGQEMAGKEAVSRPARRGQRARRLTGRRCGYPQSREKDSDIWGVLVVRTASIIRAMEPVHTDRPSMWRRALGWIALAVVGVLAIVVATAGINVEWFNGSPGPTTSSGGFNLTIVPLKHPVPQPGFYCGGISWLSATSPIPALVAAEVNAAPNAATHGAALKFYDDLVNGRSTRSDLAALATAYACPNGE